MIIYEKHWDDELQDEILVPVVVNEFYEEGKEMTVEDVVKAYADELENWEFFSDHQVCRLENGHIIVCLRNYNWYITKEPIKDCLTAIKALFEIDWIAEYDDDGEDFKHIDYSKYWREQ